MNYLDASLVLARLFAEDRSPVDAFWTQAFISSRLLEYEVLNRVHARALGSVLVSDAQQILDQFTLLDLSVGILARAQSPFPVPVRTLDGLHLASMDFLRANGQTIKLATYDRRLAAAAQALGFPLTEL